MGNYYAYYAKISRLEQENAQLRVELAKLKGEYPIYKNIDCIPLYRAYATVWKTSDSFLIKILKSKCYKRIGYVNSYDWILVQKIEILMFKFD